LSETVSYSVSPSHRAAGSDSIKIYLRCTVYMWDYWSSGVWRGYMNSKSFQSEWKSPRVTHTHTHTEENSHEFTSDLQKRTIITTYCIRRSSENWTLLFYQKIQKV